MIKKLFNKVSEKLAAKTSGNIKRLSDDFEKLSTEAKNQAVSQKILSQLYRETARNSRDVLPSFSDVGFRKYSQFEEDGILLYIFSLIQPRTRICVEICAGDGTECNTANLIINHGWWGHLFDGDTGNVLAGREFYSNLKDTGLYPPRFTSAWITAENVNDLLLESGAAGPIDLLSLDIDGMDYWVWKAIKVIDPIVVVCETHNPIPPDMALTVPYKSDFVCESDNFRGASLAAMTKLGRSKGYRLVGTHRYGFNAFFVKDGFGDEYLPEVDVASCVQDPFSVLARRERWPDAEKFGWQKV